MPELIWRDDDYAVHALRQDGSIYQDLPVCLCQDLAEFHMLETDLSTVARRVGVYHDLEALIAAIEEIDAAGGQPDGNVCLDNGELVASLWTHK